MVKQVLNIVRVAWTKLLSLCLYFIMSLHLKLGCAVINGYWDKTGTMEVNKVELALLLTLYNKKTFSIRSSGILTAQRGRGFDATWRFWSKDAIVTCQIYISLLWYLQFGSCRRFQSFDFQPDKKLLRSWRHLLPEQNGKTIFISRLTKNTE